MGLVLRLGLLAVLGALSFASDAQPRDRMVEEIIAIQRSVDLPMFREQGLPTYARSDARKTLERLGREAGLGPGWRRGNPHWDRAEAALTKDRLRMLDVHATARDRQEEENYREALRELPDDYLAEVHRFYTSELFRKSVRQVDASLTLLSQMLDSLGRGSDPEAENRRIEREFERFKLSEAEESEHDRILASPAFRTLNRGAAGQVLRAMADPSAGLRSPIAESTAHEVRALVAEFRQANGIPPPLPQAYTADFISSPAVEKAMRELGNAALRGDRPSLDRLRRTADEGNAFAQVELGRVYAIPGTTLQDPRQAFEWTRKAADQGLPRALFNLGVHYEHGQGTESDLPRAVETYRKAAERKFARAQLALGLLYRHGRGVPQDFQESLLLIRAAADQELPAAQLAMAEIYDVGAGIGKDEAAASSWLARAQNNGHAPALQYRADRERRKAELAAMLQKSPASARGSRTAVDKAELNRRLLDATKKVDIAYVGELLEAGADVETADLKPNEGETPLHHAARTGNVELAKLLVAKGGRVNVSAPSGFTPLHVAAGLNRQAMTEYLLLAGADPNAKDSRGTALHAAVVQGHAVIVTLLLEAGADPNATDQSGRTPLHMLDFIASYYPTHTEVIKRLAESGANLFATKGSPPYVSTAVAGAIRHTEDAALAVVESRARLVSDNPDAMPLPLILARAGYMKALQVLERKGVRLDAADRAGETALHAAAGAGHREVANYLLSRGLKIDVPNAQGMSPLYRAADYGQAEMVKHLLELGADPETRTTRGRTPLMAAVTSRRDAKALTILLARKASLRSRDNDDNSVLELALRYDFGEGLGPLLDAGAPVGDRDSTGRTALHKVTSAEQVQLLLSRGADIHARDVQGMTPLFHAVQSEGQSEEIATAMIAAGARLDVVAKDGSRLVHHAAMRSTKTLQLVLAKAGGGASDRTADGRTPLHYAAEKGHPGAIDLLLGRGADPNAKASNGDSPLVLAARAKRHDNVAALLKGGADPEARNASGESALDVARRDADLAVLRAFGIGGR